MQGSECDRMSKKADPIADAWAEIDAGSDTLKLRDLVGQTFIIESVRLVNTPYGQTYVGQISSESLGVVDAWLTPSEGGDLFKKIAAVEADESWPRTVLLTKDEGEKGAYHLDLV